ncbi:uncharacterized protein EDB91DRAFT_1081216 [Suillus paluster]|uniref:uncharacterized protein n=1 Tax=Suillus paluster TaxID=48578 RepID=UPI001B86486E|nr:uncharacterized protein EDB91DRAFT_1081216 [Suillus paluster]KAG1743281.1 hypothetical protein EDB91DRAFT_1081216 [Suillus paluster]
MTHLRLPVLQALVRETGAKPTHNVPMNNEDQMQVDSEPFVAEELGKEYAADIEEKNDQKGIFTEALTDEEINTIQAELSGIKRPSWHRGPPKKHWRCRAWQAQDRAMVVGN